MESDFDEMQDGPDVEWYGGGKDFRGDVARLLMDEKFDVNDDYLVRWNRADRYSNCGDRFRVRGHRECRYRDVSSVVPIFCGLKGCSVCGPTFRLRLVNRYLRLLSRVRGHRLYFVTLSYARVNVEYLDVGADWLFKKVRAWLGWRVRVAGRVWQRMFYGGVFRVESKQKVGDSWYVHVHGIVVGEAFDYGTAENRWEKLTGSGNADFQPVRSVKGALFYMAKYLLKGVESLDVKGTVDFMSRMHGVRLLRGYGCLYGSGKGIQGKPDLGIEVERASVSERTSSLGSLSKSEVVVRENRVCPDCGLALERGDWVSMSAKQLESYREGSSDG